MEIPSLNTQNGLLLKNLLEFYQNEDNIKKLLKIVSGETKISLRIVDWFVTNYAKKYYVVYTIPEFSAATPTPSAMEAASGAVSEKTEHSYDMICNRFKVYNEYKLKLKAYSKRRFDPFCRWDRISIPIVDATDQEKHAIDAAAPDVAPEGGGSTDAQFETTIGQLNFFKWAITNRILDYIESNYEQIESDMNLRNTVSKKKNVVINDVKTRKKREELSVSACKAVKKENVEIVIKFT